MPMVTMAQAMPFGRLDLVNDIAVCMAMIVMTCGYDRFSCTPGQHDSKRDQHV